MNKEIKIEGLPDIVKVTTYRETAWANINLDGLQYDEKNTPKLAEAIVRLKDMGFVFSGITHTLGYYDSVEDITLEFTHRNFKK